MNNVQPTKDTIYIDADDEITAIIEKVRASDAKVVALVLPKRAATLQSVVNLKLLKRSAKTAKKSLVLITSEESLMPVAGAVGLHVAKTLQSKPEVPEAPKPHHVAETVDSEAGEAPLDASASIGQLAGHVATEETIDLDNEAEASTKKKTGKKTKNKKLKIPDFNRFRLLLFGGIGLLILLLVGSVFAFGILPKAKIVIKTDTTNVDTDLLVTAKTGAKEVDVAGMVVPATTKSVKKTETEKAPTTGQRDDGTKATGNMTVTNCSAAVVDLPAGTVFASGDKKFSSNAAISVPKSGYANTPAGFVCNNDGAKTVAVTATGAGGTYNLNARSYNIESGPTNVSANGSAMSGGTSNLVQVASQSDVDTAKQKAIDRMNMAAADELKAAFMAEGLIPITDTFAGNTPTVVSSPNVNEAGAEVSVSVTITYTELGVKQDDVKQIVEDEVKKHIDNDKQVIQDNGISKATILTIEKKSADEVKFNIKTLAIAGPQLDQDGIKKQVAGKSKTETEKLIKARPAIKDVTVSYSPFWIFSTPKSTSHIKVTFDQNNAGE